MLSYAFSSLNQSNFEDVATEEFENMHNLFAAILSKGIGQQLKQGLYREYLNKTEDMAVVRGKINWIWHSRMGAQALHFRAFQPAYMVILLKRRQGFLYLPLFGGLTPIPMWSWMFISVASKTPNLRHTQNLSGGMANDY